MIFSYFFSFRYIVLLIALGAFTGSVIMLSIGLIETFDVFNMYLFGIETPIEFTPIGRGSEISELMTVGVLNSLLFGLLLVIFSHGVYVLYMRNFANRKKMPKWLKIKDMKNLKETLSQAIVVILFVKFLELILEMVVYKDKYFSWEHILLPIFILFLSFGFKRLFEE